MILSLHHLSLMVLYGPAIPGQSHPLGFAALPRIRVGETRRIIEGAMRRKTGGAHLRDLEHDLSELLSLLHALERLYRLVQGITRSTTARAFDSVTKASILLKSSGVPIVDPRMSSCFQKMRLTISSWTCPVVAPYVTTRPPGRTASSAFSNVSAARSVHDQIRSPPFGRFPDLLDP